MLVKRRIKKIKKEDEYAREDKKKQFELLYHSNTDLPHANILFLKFTDKYKMRKEN